MTETSWESPEEGENNPQDGEFKHSPENAVQPEVKAEEPFEEYLTRISNNQQYETLLNLEESVVKAEIMTQREFDSCLIKAYTIAIHDWLERAFDIEKEMLELKATLPETKLDTDDDGGAADARSIALELSAKRRARMLKLIPPDEKPPSDAQWDELIANCIYPIDPDGSNGYNR